MKHFYGSILFSIFGFFFAAYWGGAKAIALISLLSILEISLSFDNAVLNASLLSKLSKKWQHRFLTWGIIIAVFGVRFLLPIVIVALTARLPYKDVIYAIFNSPEQYAKYLHNSHIAISSFGGMFLLLVFITFLFDQKRNIHWLGKIERKLNSIGRLASAQIVISLLILISIQYLVPKSARLEVLIPGIIAIILFSLLHGLIEALNHDPRLITKNGFYGFLYLEVLDSSFSLDGVIGAFAITQDVIIIMIGLAIGAIFVRSLTIFLIHKNTLKKYLFIEHGAHYAIGALAIIMLAKLKYHVPETLTGLIGVSFIALSLLSSIKHNKVKAK